MTILLVDDDRNQHEMFREVVRRIDPAHRCLKEFSTESALETLQEADAELPDLIFLNLKFRAAGGQQMLKDLKKSKTLRNIPVCIFTDSAHQSDRDTSLELGAIGYIVKDTDLTSLKESIKSVIAMSH